MASKPEQKFEGRWRITWMDQWDQDYIDEEVEGFFEFQPNGIGSFHFGYVRGEINYRAATRDGRPCIEFSWDGNDEMEPEQGDGWAIVDDDELNGIITFHQDDEAVFKCRRK